MVGYIEICEINGLGQEAETLCFFGKHKKKRNMWLHILYPSNTFKSFLHYCIVLVKGMLYENIKEAQYKIYFTQNISYIYIYNSAPGYDEYDLK